MSESTQLIGVISDTHGKLDERVLALFAGASRIIHAGDIGDEELIWRLEKVAPVIAVRGNTDASTMCFPNERLAVIGRRTFYVRHQFATVDKMTAAQQRIIEQRMPDVVVFGHSHKAYSASWRGTLFFNPGGAGPKRFNLPRSVGLIELSEESIDSRIVILEDN
ncbi:MAG TPA: metallophosphoesterase family protein [Pyrinomonadaceae bacterium]|nr:metallophosphoesterase family protein [Pyrinomonadaceae bacterium]